MAFDPGIAELLRDGLAGESVVEKKMFGGLAFMLAGNMVCCAMDDGAIFRPGKPQMTAALALPGVEPMEMQGRQMGGFVVMREPDLSDDDLRGRLMALSLAFVHSLPAK